MRKGSQFDSTKKGIFVASLSFPPASYPLFAADLKQSYNTEELSV